MLDWFGFGLLFEVLAGRGIKGWRAILLLWVVVVALLLVLLTLVK